MKVPSWSAAMQCRTDIPLYCDDHLGINLGLQGIADQITQEGVGCSGEVDGMGLVGMGR